MLKLPVKYPIDDENIDLSEYAKKSDVDAIDASLDNKADKKDVKELSAQLDTIEQRKADEIDLQVLSERMNQFTSLQQGSTTGDAELIDGRIDNDGITHTNIGSSIRTQIDKVNKTLLKESISFTVEGYYIDKDANVNQLGGWRATDYIKINRGDIVQITALGYQDNVSGVYLYDNFKNKIKPLQILNDTNQSYTVIVPSDGYIRCSGRSNKNDVLSGTIYRLNPELSKFIKDYNKNNIFNLYIDVWNNGGYICYDNGEIVEYNGYSYTNYIDISDLNNMYMYITEYYQYLGGIAFYDENMKFISGIGIGGNHAHENLGKLSIIQLKGKYMRITCTTDDLSKFKLYTSLKLISKSINYFHKKDISINSAVSLHDNFTWTAGAYIKYDTGEVISINNNYSYTDYIDISTITNATVQMTEYYDYASGIAFYDKNKNFISGVNCESSDVNNNLGQVINLTLKGHYMRITCKTDFIYSFKMYFNFGDLIFKKTDNINPCFYNGNLNLIKIFNKVACIGDSYTEGAIEYKTSDGRTLQSIDSRYSYPTQLSKIANIQTVNLGHAGYTTTQWYNKYKDTDLSGYDCAIIWLSINDWFNGKVFQKEQYVNIINKLRTDNKNIPIFCITNTKNYLTTAYTFNEEIKEVALNNNCYIIDLGEYSDWTPKSKWLNGSHPNAYGYYHNAEMINSYINYIIENNKADFYNLSFVGTDKIDF